MPAHLPTAPAQNKHSMAKKFVRKTSKADLKNSLDGFKPSRAGLNAVLPGSAGNQAELEELRGKLAAQDETLEKLNKTFRRLPLDVVHPNPDQPRKDFDETALHELADSIAVHGIIQPITVREMGDGTYQIISGERRFRASHVAAQQDIPAFILTATDQTLLEMGLIENIQREDLNPMEVAYSYYLLKNNHNLTQEQVAHRVGKPRGSVGNYLTILNHSPVVQDAIRERKISIGVAKTFSAIKDHGQQELFLKEILSNPEWNVRKIEKEAKGYKTKNKSSAQRQPESDDLKTVKEAFQRFFGTKQVKVSLDGKKEKSGSVTINFSNLEQLEEFYKAVE